MGRHVDHRRGRPQAPRRQGAAGGPAPNSNPSSNRNPHPHPNPNRSPDPEQEAAQKLAKEEAEASPSPEPSPEPAEAGVESCTAVVGQTAADDAWCIQNCGNVPPNCPAELCSCGGKEVASAQPAGPAVPAVPDVPVPSPGVSNPSLNEAVADRASQHDAEQERFRKADEAVSYPPPPLTPSPYPPDP